MDAKKALIITWIIIGLLVAGTAGFFLGRSNAGRGLNNLNNLQGPGQGPGNGNHVVSPSSPPPEGVRK